MAGISNKKYDALITLLESMADGVQKYGSDAKISANFKEDALRSMKSEIESLRSSYIQKETEARKAYDAFENRFKGILEGMAGNTRIIKGIYGRAAEELKDFGISPEKARAKTKPKSKDAA